MTKDSRKQTVDSYQQSAISSQQSAVSNQPADLLSPVSCLLGSKGSTLLGKITQAKACGYSLPPTPYPPLPNKRGFTLLEIVIVLAITGILAGGLATVGHQVIKKEWEDKTTEHMKRLKVAVVGDPLDVRHGTRTSFGYFGDMGVLPTILDNLYIRGTQPAYNPATLQTTNTAAGWNGPYINPETMEYLSNLKKDYFRQDLQYTSPASFTTYTDSTIGVQVEERIASSGRDKQAGTGDDLSVVFFNNELYSRVSGFIKDADGSGMGGVTVTLNYPSNGSLTTATATTNSDGSYTFNNVPYPYGNHSLSITTPKLFLASGTGQTLEGTGSDVYFIIVNMGGNINLTSIRVSYSMNPTTYYRRIFIGPNQVYDRGSSTIASGETITFASQSISGATDLSEPVAVCIQSPITVVPDIPLTRLGRGSATEVALTDFKTGTGEDVNMIGVVFTVTFNVGLSSEFTVTFTP